MRTFAPRRSACEVVEVPHADGTTDPDRFGAACAGAACVIFQQPNFFGCLEPAARAGGRGDAGRGACDRRTSTRSRWGCSGSPGAYGCDIAVGEGQSARQPHLLRRPRTRLLRRPRGATCASCPGGSSARRVDRGRPPRLRAHAADARAAHPPREGHLATSAPTRRCCALAATIYLGSLGPDGLRDVAELCLPARPSTPKRRGVPGCRSPSTAPIFKEFARRAPAGRRTT